MALAGLSLALNDNGVSLPLIISLPASRHRSSSSTWTVTSGTRPGSTSSCAGWRSSPSTRWWSRRSTTTGRGRCLTSWWVRPRKQVIRVKRPHETRGHTDWDLPPLFNLISELVTLALGILGKTEQRRPKSPWLSWVLHSNRNNVLFVQ